MTKQKKEKKKRKKLFFQIVSVALIISLIGVFSLVELEGFSNLFASQFVPEEFIKEKNAGVISLWDLTEKQSDKTFNLFVKFNDFKYKNQEFAPNQEILLNMRYNFDSSNDYISQGLDRCFFTNCPEGKSPSVPRRIPEQVLVSLWLDDEKLDEKIIKQATDRASLLAIDRETGQGKTYAINLKPPQDLVGFQTMSLKYKVIDQDNIPSFETKSTGTTVELKTVSNEYVEFAKIRFYKEPDECTIPPGFSLTSQDFGSGTIINEKNLQHKAVAFCNSYPIQRLDNDDQTLIETEVDALESLRNNLGVNVPQGEVWRIRYVAKPLPVTGLACDETEEVDANTGACVPQASFQHTCTDGVNVPGDLTCITQPIDPCPEGTFNSETNVCTVFITVAEKESGEVFIKPGSNLTQTQAGTLKYEFELDDEEIECEEGNPVSKDGKWTCESLAKPITVVPKKPTGFGLILSGLIIFTLVLVYWFRLRK